MDKATIIYLAVIIPIYIFLFAYNIAPIVKNKELREELKRQAREKAARKTARKRAKRAQYAEVDRNTLYGRYKRMMRGEDDWWEWK